MFREVSTLVHRHRLSPTGVLGHKDSIPEQRILTRLRSGTDVLRRYGMSSGKLPFLGLRRSKITILRWDFTCLLHTMYVRVGDVYVNPRGSIYKYLKEV